MRFKLIMLFSAMLSAGILLIVGTLKGWKFLVDPPEEWASFYSQSLLKKLFGASILPLVNLLLGIPLSIIAFMLLIISIINPDVIQ